METITDADDLGFLESSPVQVQSLAYTLHELI